MTKVITTARTRRGALAEIRSWRNSEAVIFKQNKLREEAARIVKAEHPNNSNVIVGHLLGQPVESPAPVTSFNGWNVGDEFEWNAWCHFDDSSQWCAGYHRGWSEGPPWLKATIVSGAANHHFVIETIRPWTKQKLKTKLRFEFSMFLDTELVRRNWPPTS